MGIPILKIWDNALKKYVGVPAIKGDKGDKGDPGYTPQKGVDYYTDADKTAIANEVKNGITIPTKTSQLTNDSGFLSTETVGKIYKGAWIATECTGISQRYTEAITLPAGTYVVSVVLPYASSGGENQICIGFTASMAIGTGNTFLRAAYGCATMIATFTTTTSLAVISAASANSATWGYLERGGIAAVRIA